MEDKHLDDLLTLLNSADFTQLCQSFKHFTELYKSETERSSVTSTTLETLANSVSKLIDNKDVISTNLECIVEGLRCLRNSCAGIAANQNVLAKDTSIVQHCVMLLSNMTEKSLCDEGDLTCIRCMFQFLGNLVVSNSENQVLVWELANVVLCKGLQIDDEKSVDYAAMALYNILVGLPRRNISPGRNIVVKPLLEVRFESEFVQYCSELLIREQFLDVYKSLDGSHQIAAIDILHGLLVPSDSSNISYENIPLQVVDDVSAILIELLDEICNNFAKYKNELSKFQKILKLLEFLGIVSGDTYYLKGMQQDVKLLTDCVALLRLVHEDGKASGSYFTAVEKLSALTLHDEEFNKVESQPSYGFKRSLVRLIANLVYHHRESQDVVRKHQGIETILECSTIDARNPLISQWVLLAIRNLLENNTDNQNVIAQLQREGVVDSSVLREVGVAVQERDGVLYVRNLPR